MSHIDIHEANAKANESNSKFVREMRIEDPGTQEPLYVNARERELFLEKAKELDNPKYRLFCEVLHWTGCRISEALELKPRNIFIDENAIQFRTLKRRDRAKIRYVPVPKELIENIDLAFGVRKAKRNQKGLNDLFWPSLNNPNKPMSRTTGWNIVKRVFESCGIEGKRASPKGFRHGYGVAMTLAGMDVYKVAQYLGHASPETTQIYRQAVGADDHKYAMAYWEKLEEIKQR